MERKIKTNHWISDTAVPSSRLLGDIRVIKCPTSHPGMDIVESKARGFSRESPDLDGTSRTEGPCERDSLEKKKDNDREAVRSKEKILLWGVVPPLLSDGGGMDSG